MRKIIILMFLSILNLSCIAKVKLESGSLCCLKGEKTVAVSLDLTRIKYNKALPFKDFLSLGRRVTDWKERSLDYFVKEFNDECYKRNLSVTTHSRDAKYILVLTPLVVYKDGSISGNAYLREVGSTKLEATMAFKSDDGDNDDPITFKDPMDELGESFAKLFIREIKKANK